MVSSQVFAGLHQWHLGEGDSQTFVMKGLGGRSVAGGMVGRRVHRLATVFGYVGCFGDIVALVLQMLKMLFRCFTYVFHVMRKCFP